jgi:hypothetical protein
MCPGGVVCKKEPGSWIETCACSIEEKKEQVETEERAPESRSHEDRKRFLLATHIIARSQ